MVEPGGTIGILGGGQLGRMTALAAAALGYRCHVFCPERESPAALVAAASTVAPYADKPALDRFAAAVDVVTFEFENVPAETADYLAERRPLHPGPEILRIAQDRLREKEFLRSIGVATARYEEVTSAAALARAVRDIGPRCVLKTVRLGYDGKGQVTIGPDSDLDATWRALGTDLGVLEGFIDFRCEISVVAARSASGGWASYVPVENRHVNHILDTTIAPARVAPELAMRAEAVARHVAERLDLVGLLAVEMFVTADGGVLVNELAPRPHNSGHWTIDACYTSQFEQFVRAVCDLPLGSAERHSDAVMTNLIGDEINEWRDAKPGRKMGHVTRLMPRH